MGKFLLNYNRTILAIALTFIISCASIGKADATGRREKDRTKATKVFSGSYTYIWLGAAALLGDNSWTNPLNWTNLTNALVGGYPGLNDNNDIVSFNAVLAGISVTVPAGAHPAISTFTINGVAALLNPQINISTASTGSLAITGGLGVGYINILTPTTTVLNMSGNITLSSAVNIYPGALLNFTSTANASLSAATVNFYNNATMTNSGIVTANGSSVFNLSGNSNSITNYGNFYAGTASSACTINLSGSNATINNTSQGALSGQFSLSSTSVIYPTAVPYVATAGNNGIIKNDPACAACTFTLQSDASGCATFGPLPTNNTAGTGFVGKFNVQRYITGGSLTYRSYRLLSSPVYGSTDANGNHIYSINYLSNTSYITGTTGIPGGFDKAGNPTLYLYRENVSFSNTQFTSGNFRGINTLGTAPNYNYLIDGDPGTFNIPAGNGFLFFYRGDRTSATVSAETTVTYVPTSATLNTAGSMNQGKITFADWYTPSSTNLGYTTTTGNATVMGFNLAGNPYPSSIDWDTYSAAATTSSPIYAPNIDGAIYILDPVSKNYGVYMAGTPGKTGTHNATNIIVSGQGFMVKATGTTQLIFNESAKVGPQLLGSPLLSAIPVNIQSLHLQFKKDSVNTDDLLVMFNPSATAGYVVGEDALYKPGSGQVSLSSMTADNIPLAISKLPLPQKSQVVKLNVNATSDGTYQLNMMSLPSIPSGYEVWLKDAEKKDSLNMRNGTPYTFSIAKADTNSFGANRFSLVILQKPLSPTGYVSFTATETPSGSLCNWIVNNQPNYVKFEVQRSVDNGLTFTTLGSFTPSNTNIYSYLDKVPQAINIYRLKMDDNTENVTYSPYVTLIYANPVKVAAVNKMLVYPNPANSTINLSMSQNITGYTSLSSFPTLGSATTATTNSSVSVKATLYDIKIVSITGVVVKSATSTQPSWAANISNLSPGTYFIEVLSDSDKHVLGKSKFIKQ